MAPASAVAAELSPAVQTRPSAVRGVRAGKGERFAGGLVSLFSGGVLGLAAYLVPSTQGHGTHTQLGLPQCGWVIALGKPCPTCGMTTAVTHAAHGNLWESFVTQPFGLLVAFGLAAAFWVGLFVAATGSQVGRSYGTMLRPRVLWALAVLAGMAWAYKWMAWPAG